MKHNYEGSVCGVHTCTVAHKCNAQNKCSMQKKVYNAIKLFTMQNKIIRYKIKVFMNHDAKFIVTMQNQNSRSMQNKFR